MSTYIFVHIKKKIDESKFVWDKELTANKANCKVKLQDVSHRCFYSCNVVFADIWAEKCRDLNDYLASGIQDFGFETVEPPLCLCSHTHLLMK